MARPAKSEQKPDLKENIKKIAKKMVHENGAPSLSLRAIARELDITALSI